MWEKIALIVFTAFLTLVFNALLAFILIKVELNKFINNQKYGYKNELYISVTSSLLRILDALKVLESDLLITPNPQAVASALAEVDKADVFKIAATGELFGSVAIGIRINEFASQKEKFLSQRLFIKGFDPLVKGKERTEATDKLKALRAECEAEYRNILQMMKKDLRINTERV